MQKKERKMDISRKTKTKEPSWLEAVEYTDYTPPPLKRSKAPLHSNECPDYDTKPSYGEAPGLELCGMWSTPSLSLLPAPLRLEVEIPVSVPSMGQIEIVS